MRMHHLPFVVTVVFAASLAAFAEKPQEPEDEPAEFELTVREGNGAYGTAAFSFRFAPQSLRVHRNLVDLVYNRCGNLHVNAHGGMKSRIANLGAVDFEEADAIPKKGWKTDCIRPQEGHVYVQEINFGRLRAYVKFKIAAVERTGRLKLKWARLTPDDEWPRFGGGGAGTMGQCGGFHEER